MKICNFCNFPIHRGGVEIHKEQGFGFSHHQIIAHKNCAREYLKVPKHTDFLAMLRAYGGTIKVDNRRGIVSN